MDKETLKQLYQNALIENTAENQLVAAYNEGVDAMFHQVVYILNQEAKEKEVNCNG